MAQKPTNSSRKSSKRKRPGVTAVTILVPRPKKPRPSPPPEQAAHLKPFWFKKGQSGNPTGIQGNAVRLSEAYQQALAELDEHGVPGAVAIARGQRAAAIKGNTFAAKEMRESTEGKLPEHHHVTGTLGHIVAQAGEEELDTIIAELRQQLGEERAG